MAEPGPFRLRECRVEQGHLMAEHVHMLLSIPPEIRAVAGGGIHQGRDSFGAGVRGANAKLPGPAFLGQRLACLDRRSGQSNQAMIREYIKNQE
jgi:putative transposase